MLTTNLSRYEQIEVVSSQRLFDILRLMGKQDLPAIDKTVATEIAGRAGVKTMLLGSISKLGEKILVSSQLTDVQTGNIITSEQAEGRKIDDLPNMVDDLTAKIGAKMAGPAAGGIPGFKIADVSTSSPGAYRHYLDGVENFQRWRFDAAAKSFEKAVEVDSTFALAHLWLALAKAEFGLALTDPSTDFASIENSLMLAKKYSNKATEKDRLLIAAMSAEGIKSQRTYLRELTEKYPREKTGFFWLSFICWLSGDMPGAKVASEKGLELDPADGILYNQLAYSNMFLGDRAGTTSAIRKYIAVQPETFNAYLSGWEADLTLGMVGEAERFLDEASKANPKWEARVNYYRGWTALFERESDKARELFQAYASFYPKSAWANLYPRYPDLLENRFASAVAPFKAAVQAFQNADDAASEIYGHLYLGEILAATQRHDEAIAEFMAAAKISRKRVKPEFDIFAAQAEYLAGVSEIRKGDLRAAEARAGSLPSSGKTVIVPIPLGDYRLLLTAEMCMAKKDFPAAREILEKTTWWAKIFSPRYQKISADLTFQAGDSKKAIEEYGYFYTHRMATGTSYFLADALFYLEVASRLDYYLGQIYEKMGEKPQAAEHYRKFLDLMKNADSGIKEIDEARGRLSKIE